MYKLVISDDEGKTIIVPLVRDLITIGRQEGNTIRLTERNVSRQHARLVKVDDHYRIEDLDAYNGVRINGERVKGARDLVDGDRIGIGDYTLALHLEAEVAATKRHSNKPPAPPAAVATSVSQPARLVMISAPAPGAEFSIGKDSVRVGRLEELDLCISHRSISREHAEITREGDGFKVQDLGSANGVRVNGALIKSSALHSGDLLDLGQVRFRFVGPGEAYSFEADEAQVSAQPVLPYAKSHARTIVVVAAAVVVAGVLALSGGEPETPVGESVQVRAEPIVTTAAVPQDQSDSDAEVAAQLAAALEGCRTALEAGRYDEAVKTAQNGLMLDEEHAGLSRCREEAAQLSRDEQAFTQAKSAFEEGDVDAAYLLLAGLDDDSPYREDPLYPRIFDAYGRAQLEQASSRLSSAPDEAARLAAEVLELSPLDESVRDEARALRERAEQAEAFPEQARANARERARKPARTAERKSRQRKQDGLLLAESPAKMARSCLARGDQKCAVRALEGRARTAQELALLIETYRALGDTRRALRSMQQFVKQYPSARQADGYRAFIERNGQ